MRAARDLLASFRFEGISITRDGNHLIVDGLSNVLTDTALDLIRAHKGEIIALLRAEERDTSGVLASSPISTPPTYWGWDELPPFDGNVTDEQYEAVKWADVKAHGEYKPNRRYSTPAEDPRAIWERLQVARGAAAPIGTSDGTASLQVSHEPRRLVDPENQGERTPTAACTVCQSRRWWYRAVACEDGAVVGDWICGTCHPDPAALRAEWEARQRVDERNDAKPGEDQR